MTYCYCIKVVVVVLDVVNVFNKAIPCRFDFVELSGNHVEPCVGFGDFFEAQGDHAAHVALGAGVGEVVCHVYTMPEILQVVNFNLLFFSLFFDGLAAVGWHRTC